MNCGSCKFWSEEGNEFRDCNAIIHGNGSVLYDPTIDDIEARVQRMNFIRGHKAIVLSMDGQKAVLKTKSEFLCSLFEEKE